MSLLERIIIEIDTVIVKLENTKENLVDFHHLFVYWINLCFWISLYSHMKVKKNVVIFLSPKYLMWMNNLRLNSSINFQWKYFFRLNLCPNAYKVIAFDLLLNRIEKMVQFYVVIIRAYVSWSFQIVIFGKEKKSIFISVLFNIFFSRLMEITVIIQ